MLWQSLKSFFVGGYYKDTPTDELFLQFVARVTDGDFLHRLKIKDDFDNRTATFTAFLFCWLAYFDRHKKKRLRRQFIDLTVKLLDDSLHREGISDMRIGKKVKHHIQAVYAQLFAYDKLFGDHAGSPTTRQLQATLQKYITAEDGCLCLADYLLAFRGRLDTITPDELFHLKQDDILWDMKNASSNAC